MTKFNWQCPHCGSKQVVTDANYSEGQLLIENFDVIYGRIGLVDSAIKCLNEDCEKLTILSRLYKFGPQAGYLNGKYVYEIKGDPIHVWRLIPDNISHVQPEYIPKPIRDDYYEACKIRDLSPKASATLARRCLQGMIRDFCGISRKRLIDEIVELRKQVEAGNATQGVTLDSVAVIDHVRSLGNIGAHMEADVNVIIDVEPSEAQILIEVIESLFYGWYVTRQTRNEHFSAVARLAQEKKAKKDTANSSIKPPTP